MTINLSAHVARLRTLHAAGRLIRRKWTGTHADGRPTACLLAAISPETGVVRSARACPAYIMPLWLAHLVPWFDAAVSDTAWDGMVTRFADLAGRWHVLSDADWRQMEFAARAICVREAASHTQVEDVTAICARVIALCDRVTAGDEPAAKEWGKAALAAHQVAAETAATWAAYAATYAATWAATWAAYAASRTGWVAAYAALRTAREAADAADAAPDRMTAAIFAAIETRIAAIEEA